MIYALLDHNSLEQSNIPLGVYLQYINFNHISILQYRNKIGSLSEKEKTLKEIRKQYSETLIVNDTIELIDYVDGLHIGQEDIKYYGGEKAESIDKIRQRIGRKILGLSTHNRAEIEEANRLDIDYIGLGAYRSTDTKSDAEVKGDALLEIARVSRHPVAIIGGVKLSDRFDKSIRYSVVGSDIIEEIRRIGI